MTKSNNYFIDILIPTYNRKEFVVKNIYKLISYIHNLNLYNKVRILVSDNHSIDGTYNDLKDIIANIKDINIMIYKQEENIGLEPNVLFLLEKAEANFIMYLGDDDIIDQDYFEEVFKIIQHDDHVTCIIPGFSLLYSDGTIIPARYANFKEKMYKPGFFGSLILSQYGHQLSGLVFKRQDLYQAYMSYPKYRNIYPFIFFVGYNILRGNSYYLPKYQTLVYQDNTKDWKYDDSGLLKDIFKNYALLYSKSQFKIALSQVIFVFQQRWRLRLRKPKYAFKAYLDLLFASEINILTKFMLPFIYPVALVLFFKKIIFKLFR